MSNKTPTINKNAKFAACLSVIEQNSKVKINLTISKCIILLEVQISKLTKFDFACPEKLDLKNG